MELYISSSFLTSLSILTVSLLVFILNILRTKTVKTRKPPQPNGAWPIIGHIHLLGGSKLAHKVLGDMADKHGPIFTIKLGVHQALVVSNVEMVKECLTTNDKVFASRPKSEATKLMAYNYALFGLAPYGDYWRKVRKIITLEVLSQRRVEMHGDVYEAWVNDKDSENLGWVKVEMSSWFGNLVLNIVVRVISGKRFSRNDEEGVWLQLVVKEYFRLIGSFVVSDFIPYLKCFDLGGYRKAMKKTGEDLDNIFAGWLKDHKIRDQHEGNQVFIDVLTNILQQLVTAGIDTTSVTLTWALSLLLNNPKSLKFAQDELDEQVSRDRQVEESDMKNLVYLDRRHNQRNDALIPGWTSLSSSRVD